MKKKCIAYLMMASLLCWASLGVMSEKTSSNAANGGTVSDNSVSGGNITKPEETTKPAETTRPAETARPEATNPNEGSASGSGNRGGGSSNRNDNPAPVQEPERSSIGVITNIEEAINRMQNGVVTVDTTSPIDSASLRRVAEAGGQLNVFAGPGVLWHFASVTNPDVGLNPVVDIGADISDVRVRMNGVQGTVIRFMHNGVLPGTANVALTVPYAPGTTLYFYYFNRSTQLFEFQQTAVVAQGGFVAVTLTHCSDYVLTTAPLISGVANGPVPTTRNAGRLDGTPHTGI